jgi:sec-independent protein translocase protein TatA
MLNTILLFLNIGGPEMIVIIFVALLLFGGEKLPQIARGLGKGIRDFKDASEGVKREITNQINNYEEKRAEEPVNAPHVPEATFEHNHPEGPLTLEHHTEAHDTNLPNPLSPPQAVPNTIPYVENHVAENHVITEHTEIKPLEETKTEPVKTTHE